MQGILTVTKEWKDINTLDLRDINGGALTLGAASGDKIKAYDVLKIPGNNVIVWQGVEPAEGTILGGVVLDGDIVIGVDDRVVYVRCTGAESRRLTIELVKGA